MESGGVSFGSVSTPLSTFQKPSHVCKQLNKPINVSSTKNTFSNYFRRPIDFSLFGCSDDRRRVPVMRKYGNDNDVDDGDDADDADDVDGGDDDDDVDEEARSNGWK